MALSESSTGSSSSALELLIMAADTILVLHALFVAFIVLSLGAVILGQYFGWDWVACPLTRWENTLRTMACAPPYSDAFIGHWLTKRLYYNCPD